MLSDVCFPRVNGVSASIRTSAKSLLGMGSEALMRQTVDLYTTLLPGAGRAGRAGHSTVNSPVA